MRDDGRWLALGAVAAVAGVGLVRRRGSGSMDKRRLLLDAAKILYDDDFEHFVNGCADNAIELATFAEAIGLSGVEVQGGQARMKRGARPVQPQFWEDEWPEPSDGEWLLHAWLLVDGERLDPTWEIVFGRPGRSYKPVEGTIGLFGVDDPEDDPWHYDAQNEILYEGLVAAGWDLSMPRPLAQQDEEE